MKNLEITTIQNQLIDSLIVSSFFFKEKLNSIKIDTIYNTYIKWKSWNQKKICNLKFVELFFKKFIYKKLDWSEFKNFFDIFLKINLKNTFRIVQESKRWNLYTFKNEFQYFWNQISTYLFFYFLNWVHNSFNIWTVDKSIRSNEFLEDIFCFIDDLEKYLKSLSNLEKNKFIKKYNYIFYFLKTIEKSIEKKYKQFKDTNDNIVVWFDWDVIYSYLQQFNKKYEWLIWKYIYWVKHYNLESSIENLFKYTNIEWIKTNKQIDELLNSQDNFWNDNFNLFNIIEVYKDRDFNILISEDNLFYFLDKFDIYLSNVQIKTNEDLDYSIKRVLQSLNSKTYNDQLILNEWTTLENFHQRLKWKFDIIFEKLEKYLIEIWKNSKNILHNITLINSWNSDSQEILSYEIDYVLDIDKMNNLTKKQLIRKRSLNQQYRNLSMLYFLELWNYTTKLLINISNYFTKYEPNKDWLNFLRNDILKSWFENSKTLFFERQINIVNEYINYLQNSMEYFKKYQWNLYADLILNNKNFEKELSVSKYILNELKKSKQYNNKLEKSLI